MSLSQSKYTSLREAVQPDPEAPLLPIGVRLSAFAVELEQRTRRSVRRRHTNHQRVVSDARALAGMAEIAGWLIQRQDAEIARLRAEVDRAEKEYDDLFWNGYISQAEQQMEQQSQDRAFVETCAVEHLFFPSILAG